ncbi:hypothetical protein K7W42_10010 [Deinococcus sp. HMF7604]|uniref:hypothetical protein n=1 Tax=Deinococcus betulae TaxID=2873312 RepID=UPI001CCF70A4|nr:hypothetical protein [Deinococcus betulae]MBZ9751198.1 hypothetical protein [Deinococcus betulae]
MSPSRLQANFAILELLLEAVSAEPDQRFGQLLWNVGVLTPDEAGSVKDPFYEELTATLRRIEQRQQETQQRLGREE